MASAFVIASAILGAWNFSISAQGVSAKTNGAVMTRRAQTGMISLINESLYTRCCMQHQAIGFAAILMATQVLAQPPAVTSPQVAPDRHIAFRILAPKAQAVSLFSTDIFGSALKNDLTKADNGLWEVTIGPIDG